MIAAVRRPPPRDRSHRRTCRDAAVVIGDVVSARSRASGSTPSCAATSTTIRIGARSNVQDNATIHVVGGRFATVLGDGVTVGHNAILHGCTVEDGALIGMGAIVLDGAVIGAESLVGAGALVTPGTVVPPRSLVLGSPARACARSATPSSCGCGPRPRTTSSSPRRYRAGR